MGVLAATAARGRARRLSAVWSRDVFMLCWEGLLDEGTKLDRRVEGEKRNVLPA